MPKKSPQCSRRSRTPSLKFAAESSSLPHPVYLRSVVECRADLSRGGLLICCEVSPEGKVGKQRHRRRGIFVGTNRVRRNRYGKFLCQRFRMGKTHHLAHDQQSRSRQLRRASKFGNRRSVRSLVRSSGARNDCARNLASDPSRL